MCGWVGEMNFELFFTGFISLHKCKTYHAQPNSPSMSHPNGRGINKPRLAFTPLKFYSLTLNMRGINKCIGYEF